MQPEVILFIIVLVVYFVGTELLKWYFDMKIQMLYAAGLYEECIEFLNKLLPRMVMTTFKQYYVRFTVYEAEGNTVGANSMLDHLLNMKASKKQRLALVAGAFNYYAKTGKKKQAQEMLDEVSQSDNAAVAADCQMTYDIVFGKRSDLIDKMEQLLASAEPDARAKLYFLLSKQYANKGDRARAQEYANLLKELEEARKPKLPRKDGQSA